MSCACGREGELQRGKQSFCMSCFCGQFETRVKKALRRRELRRGERVLAVGALAAHLVRKLVRLPLQLSVDDMPQPGHGTTLTEWTMDDECVAFLAWLGSGSEFIQHEHDIPLLLYITDEDAAHYARIHSIPFIPRQKDAAWWKFLQAFDDHPEMKRNLLRNIGELRELLREKGYFSARQKDTLMADRAK